MRDVTSANVQMVMVVDELFPQGFPLTGLTADSALSADAVQMVETRKTLDGKLVAGYTPQPIPVTLAFEPVSDAVPYLKTWQKAQRNNRRPYACHLTVTYPATGETIQLSNGFMTSEPPATAVGTTLQALSFGFTFEDVE